jgi:hypothetical protein
VEATFDPTEEQPAAMWSTRIGTRTRRSLLAATLAVATAASATVAATPATAQTAPPTEQATWGIRESYRNYINGPIANGVTTVADGAVWTDGSTPAKGPFTWPVTSALYNSATNKGTVKFAGSVFTGGHDYGQGYLVELKLEDLTLKIDGNVGTLTADLTYRPFVSASPTATPPAEQTAADAPFATIDLTGQSFTPATDGSITINAAPAKGVEATMQLIGWDQFYSSEMPTPTLDAFSATFTPAVPKIEVTRSALLNPAGENITVTGTGFDPSANIGTRAPLNGQAAGFYVVIGDFDTAWQPSSGAASSTRRVKKQIWVLPQAAYNTLNPTGTNASYALLNADGSFSVSLLAEPVASPVGNLGVYTYPGSGAVNAAQETSKLISFADPKIEVSPTTDLAPWGDTVTVTGTGFDPLANNGTRPPLSGQPAGFYVVVGDFDATWKPTSGAASSTRRVKKQIWVLPQAAYDTLNPTGTNPDIALLNADGTFEVSIAALPVASPVGNVGIYLYPGSGATNTAYEFETPIAFRGYTGPEAFVASALTDFLGASPTGADITAGVTQLAGTTKAAYLKNLSTSDAWLRSIVNKLYVDTLGRPADTAGANFWMAKIRGGMPVATVAANFYSSNEYFRGFGASSVDTWIRDLYPKLMGRAADNGGVAYWTGQVTAKGRTAVALSLYQSAETARARVRGLYQSLLGRNPDNGGLAFWAKKVVTDGDLALAVNLAGSNEYQTRSQTRFP